MRNGGPAMIRKAIAVGAGVLMLAMPVLLQGCASEVDDPSQSESVLQVENIDPSLLNVAGGSAADDFITATVSATPRNGGGGTEFNDVIIDNYTVLYDPPLNGTVPALNFAATVVVPSGGSATLTVTAVPAGMKPVAAAVVNATLQVNGRDILGNPASASGRFTIFVN